MNTATNTQTSNEQQVMLGLGDFVFSISTAAFDQLTRSDEWRWAEQARFSKNDALHYTGRPNPTITLTGKTHLFFLDGAQYGQVDKLRELGNSLTPQLLVTGRGEVLGYWSITNLSDDRTSFISQGVTKAQNFTLTLKYYGETLT
ncbi:phage tail protein [Cronobacter muytjensii]|uniref:phage tail protein n=1 Tax=Cronobacter muytjensii TaxID=413501 RepID=UPI002DBCD7E5|nr:phage tail protein [Cronobacter muytjensii]MEB8638666.1 phage tail protein [Cronobacter muytjensii]